MRSPRILSWIVTTIYWLVEGSCYRLYIKRRLNKILDWERMKTMVRNQFFPSDLAIQIKIRRNNLKQRDMDVMSYTEQFHTLSIRGGLEDEDEKVSRYINGLKYNIQDEIGLNVPRTLGECFQLAI